MGIRTPIRNSNRTKTRNYSSEYENFRRRHPRRHCCRRRQEGATTSPTWGLSKLGRFAGEWCDDNLSAKAATNWNNKFANNVARFEARFERCGHYDESQEHGGPAGAERKRRDAEDACLDIDSELC